jgi:hypothetical protein
MELPPAVQRRIVKFAVRAGYYRIRRVCKAWHAYVEEYVNKGKLRWLRQIHEMNLCGYNAFQPMSMESDIEEMKCYYKKLKNLQMNYEIYLRE